MTKRRPHAPRIENPIPADPVAAARGILKGHGPTTQDLLAERDRERRVPGLDRLALPCK